MVHPSPAERLTVQEKLLFAQAVYKVGAANWPAVSKLLVAHPCVVDRPSDLFTPEACETIYVALMTSIEINIPAPDAVKPQASVHLQLARTFYAARMEELKEQITMYEIKFAELTHEINALKSGELNDKLHGEIRTALAKKYGKKVVDGWSPRPANIIDVIEAGPESAMTPENVPSPQDVAVDAKDENETQGGEGNDDKDENSGGEDVTKPNDETDVSPSEMMENADDRKEADGIEKDGEDRSEEAATIEGIREDLVDKATPSDSNPAQYDDKTDQKRKAEDEPPTSRKKSKSDSEPESTVEIPPSYKNPHKPDEAEPVAGKAREFEADVTVANDSAAEAVSKDDEPSNGADAAKSSAASTEPSPGDAASKSATPTPPEEPASEPPAEQPSEAEPVTVQSKENEPATEAEEAKKTPLKPEGVTAEAQVSDQPEAEVDSESEDEGKKKDDQNAEKERERLSEKTDENEDEMEDDEAKGSEEDARPTEAVAKEETQSESDKENEKDDDDVDVEMEDAEDKESEVKVDEGPTEPSAEEDKAEVENSQDNREITPTPTAEASAATTPKPTTPRRLTVPSSPGSELSPASDLSPLPPEEGAAAIQQPSSPTPEVRIRGRKRKADSQPRGGPSKRGGRRGAASSPVPSQHESDPDEEHVKEEPEDEPARGRRSSRRGVLKKEATPPPPKRGVSASSTASRGTPVVAEPSVPRRRGRPPRVSKAPARAASEAASVKEEVEEDEEAGEEEIAEAEAEAEPEEERRSTRTSRRKAEKKAAVATPIEKRSRRGGRTPRPAARDSVGVEDDIESLGATSVGTAHAADPSVSVSTPGNGPSRGQRGSQRLLLSMLDAIQQHKFGPVFQQPVKKSDAPGYYDVIKRPMDLKTIRARVKDGTITTIEEFERDIRLMFANACIYNARGSQVFDMAREMQKDSEKHIAHYKSMQHHLNR